MFCGITVGGGCCDMSLGTENHKMSEGAELAGNLWKVR